VKDVRGSLWHNRRISIAIGFKIVQTLALGTMDGKQSS